jgi:hypothetical protein
LSGFLYNPFSSDGFDEDRPEALEPLPSSENQMGNDRNVQPLKRIRVALKAGWTDAEMDIPLPDAEIAFIFGIGSGGLTPFECLLNDRLENGTIAFRVAGSEAGLFFGHVAPGLARRFESGNEVHFTARIVAVETPPPREVIKAMADMAGHGAGCDCGCGCG